MSELTEQLEALAEWPWQVSSVQLIAAARRIAELEAELEDIKSCAEDSRYA